MAKKNKKRRFNLVKFLFFTIFLYLFCCFIYEIAMMPIRHIRVLNTTYLSDQVILKEAKLDNYPSFILTTKYIIKRRLSKDAFIKSTSVQKKWLGIVYLYVNEYKRLFYNTTGQLVLEDNKIIDGVKDADVPRLINYVPNVIYDELVEQMTKVKPQILAKISEIEYRPNTVDKERFLITMNDGNYVYLTLYTFTGINKYAVILPTLENKKGILYLDSGNYFEIIN